MNRAPYPGVACRKVPERVITVAEPGPTASHGFGEHLVEPRSCVRVRRQILGRRTAL